MAEEPRAASPAPSHAASVAASVAASAAASHVSVGGQSQAAAGQEQGLAQVLVSSGLKVQPAIVTLATDEVQQGLVTLGLRMVSFFVVIVIHVLVF